MSLNKNIQSLKEKIIEKYHRKLQTINQPIYIKEIFAYPAEIYNKSYGEFNNKNNVYYNKYSTIKRLIDHINFLAKTTNHYHQQQYGEKNSDGKFIIKPDCLNKITRLSLCEFSLYTTNPLTEKELLFLYKKIYKIAKHQHPNVHLVLSTFAMITDDNKILNICLYVQCGAEPKIECFVKANSSTVDPTYPQAENFKQTDNLFRIYDFNHYKNDYKPTYTNAGTAFISDREGKIISNKNVFRIKTMGGAEYTQIIDICLDHIIGHSKKLFTIQNKKNYFSFDDVIPNQVDQLITSNYCMIKPESMVAGFIANINPRIYIPNHQNNFMPLRFFAKNSIMKKYSKMSIHTLKNGIVINKPPFGCNYILITQNERKLSGFNNELKKTVEVKNKQTAKNIIRFTLSHALLNNTFYQNNYLNNKNVNMDQLLQNNPAKMK